MSYNYKITFGIKYERSLYDSPEIPDPTPNEIEEYVSKSDIIPMNPTYMSELDIYTDIKYIGNCQFNFECYSMLLIEEVYDLFYKQSLADGEWESMPGNGSFVYPVVGTDSPLGLLSFENVIVFHNNDIDDDWDDIEYMASFYDTSEGAINDSDIEMAYKLVNEKRLHDKKTE